MLAYTTLIMQLFFFKIEAEAFMDYVVRNFTCQNTYCQIVALNLNYSEASTNFSLENTTSSFRNYTLPPPDNFNTITATAALQTHLITCCYNPAEHLISLNQI